MQKSKRALEELQCFEELLYTDLQATMKPKRRRNVVCQGAIGCDRIPMYGTKSRQPTHCTDHKDVFTMVNVISRLCQHSSLCFTQASFGYNRGKPMYCKTHKQADMINVISKRCEHEFCFTVPSFGFERGNALRCGTHRLSGMWNVSASTCQYLDCKLFATYGYSNKKSLRCSAHRLPDMMTLKLIKSIQTLHESYQNPELAVPIVLPPADQPTQGLCQVCGIRALFGDCETNRAFCKQHMNPEIHWRISFCDHWGCNEVATDIATSQASKLFVCGLHSSPFSKRFVPGNSMAPVVPKVAVFEPSPKLDASSLEEQLLQALEM
jgi:hypothetical protein